MTLYFYVHEGDSFHQQLVPSLTAAWQQRSLQPCRAFCERLLPRVEEFTSQFRLGAGDSLVNRVVQGLPFSKDTWRHLVGEVLLYAAVEVPELTTASDTLCCLLAPEKYGAEFVPRAQLAPIQQVHHGSRDLILGGFYRPNAAGYNDSEDVARLATYLAEVRPAEWKCEDLDEWREDAEPDEVGEELEFARERFADLRSLYEAAAAGRRVIVMETL
jgi:hypothetical protein